MSTSKEYLIKPITISAVEHPKIHTLSLFDQLIPPSYFVPIIFFYRSCSPSSSPHDGPTSLLKASLAVVLADYYPLAGRIRSGSPVVDCNDQGALFLEARLGSSLSEFLQEELNAAAFSDESLNLLVPHHHGLIEINGDIPLVVKVTTFTCGGTALCASFAHRVLDMAGISYFLRTWAAVTSGARTEISLPPPEFNLGALYPPADADELPPARKEESIIIPDPPAIVKRAPVRARIVFDYPKVEVLKQEARSEEVENPTAVEAVGSLIYIAAVRAGWKSSGMRRSSCLIQSVNLRGRVAPPLPKSAVGNLVSGFTVEGCGEAEESETRMMSSLAWVVREMRKEKSKLLKTVGGAINRYEVRATTLKMLRAFTEAEAKEAAAGGGSSSNIYNNGRYVMNSWCGFGVYEMDFGWGKPVWVVPAGSRDKVNGVVLIDNNNNNGDAVLGLGGSRNSSIEAWVTLEAVEMGVFLRDERLLAFAHINPNPLPLVLKEDTVEFTDLNLQEQQAQSKMKMVAAVNPSKAGTPLWN